MRRINLLILLAWMVAGCAKIEMTRIARPAYFRVFNDLNYKLTLANKDKVLSTFTMLINPVQDAGGRPVSAEVVGDFIVTRNFYAPPYPSYIGNSVDIYNPEYPGKERSIAGPIMNGFDLSSWAQIQSGKKRFVFYARPKTTVPFFSLEEKYREKPLLDTVLDLEEGQVYTIHVLENDFVTKEVGALVRKEIFQTLPLSDTLTYVNFYNYSSSNFWLAPDADKPQTVTQMYQVGGYGPYNDNAPFFYDGIRDTMNVYFTLYHYVNYYDNLQNNLYAGGSSQLYNKDYIYTMIRSTVNNAVAPYFSFPVFVNANKDSVFSDIFEDFDFVHPSIVVQYMNQFGGWNQNLDKGKYFPIYCFKNGVIDDIAQEYTLPDLIVTTASGKYRSRSFGAVNSIEVINGSVYLTTVQRVYDPPSY